MRNPRRYPITPHAREMLRRFGAVWKDPGDELRVRKPIQTTSDK